MRRLVAVSTALVLGCTTVRAPVSTLPELAGNVRDGIAEPEIELWLESADAITPQEKDRAGAEAHAALERALAGRAIAPGATDAVLVVRERAVARTGSRRTSQALATAGIVIGAVVVVALVVVGIVAPHSAPKPPKPATAPAPPHGPPPATAVRPPPPAVATPSGPPAAGVRPVPAPAGRPLPAPRYPAGPAPGPYGPGYYGPGYYAGTDITLFWSFGLVLAPPPPSYEGETSAYATYPEVAPWAAPMPAREGVPDMAQGPTPGPWEPPLVPPPAAPYPVASRGFFDGDDVQLELLVLDRTTSQVTWSRTVHRGVDPRDPGEVTRLVDEALAGQSWVVRDATRAP